MKQYLILTMMCFLTITLGFAQERNCSTMENLAFRMQKDPGLAQRMQDIEVFTQNKIQNMQNNRVDGNIITIPVVVHVIYSNANENISDAQILSQIKVLNDDFRRLNTDADNVWSQAADTEIQFCLATIDPNGNATNGITRKASSRTSWGTNDDMKKASQGGVNPWDTSQYLNMWVCNIGGGILGYAQFPGGSAATDGVVMGPNYFGSKNEGSGFYLSAPFDEGRTTTHEVGHFLNLRHIWGDANCGNDFVSDTPTHQTSNAGCPTGRVSCGSADMVQNYMDYTNDACMNLFTTGQKNRMRAVLETGGVRRSLALSNKCGSSTTTPTCNDGVQNGAETGVDCGGSCAPCETACTDNQVNVIITFDNYPEETAWTLKNANGTIVASGSYSSANADGSTINEIYCLPNGCYDFEITDVYGDGICCSYGNGSFAVTNGTSTLASGGSFGSSSITNFCLGSVADTTKPVITLIGSPTINLTVGATYTELGATATDNIDGNISSNIVISGTVNTNIAGTYTRNYNVSDAAGNTADQVSRSIVVSPAPSGCSGAISTFPYNEGFESGFGNWTQSTQDDFNWTRRSGTTPSSNTGPSSASQGSQYVYMESSAPNYATKRAILLSPCFNLTNQNDAALNFKYHMYGASSMGNLQVAISTNNGATWTTLWTQSGNQGNAWQEANINLSAYAGSSVQLRFDGTTGTTWQGDMAIDAITITNGSTDKCTGILPYVSGQTYSIGQQVTYQGFLYERVASGWTNLGACGSAREEARTFVAHLGVNIHVYPNPVKGNMLNVKSTISNLPFTIVNMLGQQVAKGTTANGVQVQHLEPGMYLIQFKINNTTETRKFIKQ
ncbi:immunoglobulin-like domain-containing protein [Bizionia sediminis]|uniref:Immunoglobulin-like domain-containing protein n=1 Tax=Bizionia sediminis TaxID=1737064 RepID=A0ABW5KSN5_9FLAO